MGHPVSRVAILLLAIMNASLEKVRRHDGSGDEANKRPNEEERPEQWGWHHGNIFPASTSHASRYAA